MLETVDQQDRRNPALWMINAASQIFGQQVFRVARRPDHVLIKTRDQPDRPERGKVAGLLCVSGKHPGLLTGYVDRAHVFTERGNPLSRN